MAKSRSRRARAARRRKIRMERVEHDLTAEQWAALLEAWGGCAYCGATDKPMQRDCVLAISRGGRYTLENIVPACGSCNTSKCNDEVTAWLRRKRLNESLFLQRYSLIKKTLAVHFSAVAVAVVEVQPSAGSEGAVLAEPAGGTTTYAPSTSPILSVTVQ